MKRGLEKKDLRCLWHPFTQMRDWEQERPVVIRSARGCMLEDTEGRRYIDGVASLWVNVHGHRRPEIDRAIRAQLGRVAHSTLLGVSSESAIKLAGALIRIAPPGLTRVFYSDDGSTAVEVALKMAFQYWRQKGGRYRRRTKFIRLLNAYHGDTLGAVSVGGIELFHTLYRPLLFPAIDGPSFYCYRCEFGGDPGRCGRECLAALDLVMRRHRDELAALIVEPLVQVAGGMLVAPPGHLKAVAALCRRHGILMIADEVAVGFGRTGRIFACEHEGVTPDLLVLAKGITGGYLPLAATLATEKIYRGFLAPFGAKRTFFHGHSYSGNALACAAALASLNIFRDTGVLERLQPKIRLLARLLRPFRDLPHVGDVRQCGFMAGIELVKSKRSKAPYPYAARIGHRVCMRARRYGLMIRPLGDVLVIMPPLAIPATMLRRMLGIMHRCVREETG
ncbi:MAG: adenosylmethionine--8-amino-7-oxononanoate transaminase [Candidatus Aureabacteria bacterium]|nr:adenosylmethionine--8-amino-7-oxononanoate transaminase [Candidatus Auribacterota bacterium]